MNKIRRNNVSIKLTDDEKKRAEFFAEERDLTLSEYFRMSGLKHRIKPTVVHFEQSQNSIEESEKLIEAVMLIQKHIADNGYMHWHDYKNDSKVINALKYIRNRTFNDK